MITVGRLAEAALRCPASARQCETKPHQHERDKALEHLAIIGMACRVPGAQNYREFWDNVASGSVSMVDVGEEELRHEGLHLDPEIKNTYVPRAAPIAGHEDFDHAAFGMKAGEARGINPGHRVLMEVVLESLEDAGYDPTRHPGPIGLFSSGGRVTPPLFQHTPPLRTPPKSSDAIVWSSALDNDFLSTRIAYRLDLQGPCLTVQTSCSSSLVAVHLARQSLLSGESEIAIAAGVNLEFPHRSGYYYQQGSVWSPDGFCRPFDRSASGTIAGSGTGAVVLKPLDRAISDGDAIHAVIRGSAVNNDGMRKVGFTAPSVERQSQVISSALRVSGVEASRLGYVEAHGTATEIGDAVEWKALNRALGQEGGPCAVGAAKANIGHLGAAAGVVGLIKGVYAVSQQAIPPVANFTELHPRLTAEEGRLFVPTKGLPWEETDGPRTAGVSSLGIGGTNAHVVIEQAVAPPLTEEPREQIQIIPVSAASEFSARETADKIADFARDNPDRLSSLSHTIRVGRRVLPHREALVAHRTDSQVKVWRTGPRLSRRQADSVLVFPGQGGRRLDLERASAEIEGFGTVFSSALRSLPAETADPVKDLLTGGDGSSHDYWLTELALVVQSVVIARSLHGEGLRTPWLCGYSLGELSAGVVSGVFGLNDVAWVLSERAQILADAPVGGMLRARIPETGIEQYLEAGSSLAIVPGGRDCVLSGDASAIDAAHDRLRADGIACIRIPLSRPYHSEVLEKYLTKYTETWSKVNLQAPAMRLMSPILGHWVDDKTAVDPAFWASHLVRAVRFDRALRLLREDGADLAFTMDTHEGVTSFVRDVFPDSTFALTSRGRGEYDAESHGRLMAAAWSVGQDVDTRPDGALEDVAARIHAPTYVFDHTGQQIREPDPSIGRAILPLQLERTGMTPRTADTVTAAATEPRQGSGPRTVGRLTTEAGAGPIRDRVTQILADLVGCTAQDVDPDASFIEAGCDSFMLIQLADALSREFRASVEVRQLLGELDSCSTVATYLGDLDAAPGESAPPRSPETRAPLKNSQRPLPSQRPVTPERVLPAPTAAASFDHGGSEPMEAAYAQRTGLSKRITQEDRFALADQRNLMSFRKGRREVSYPVIGVRGEGSRFVDADGNEYIDLCMSFGVNLFGHASDPLRAALQDFEPSDLLIGPQSSTAGDVARGLASLVGVDRVAFTSSGTEAVMGAIRVARAHTGRDLIALFSGSYHGTFDGVLAAPRPGADLGEATPSGQGTPLSMAQDVIVLPYDESAIPILEAYGDRLAAVLVEPVQGRRPGHQPGELLRDLRSLTHRNGTALIFDEIVTGFRCHPRGASAVFGVHPDLVTYGKVIGGGMPIGVIGGDDAFMAVIDGGRWRAEDVGFPQRPSMVFAGTFSKHPMTMAVVKNVIAHLKKESPRLQESLNQRTAELAERINEQAAANGYPLSIEYFSSVFRFNITGSPLAADMFFLGLLNRGVYVWEGRTCFLSTAHTDADLDEVARAVAASAADVAAQGLWSAQSADHTVPVPAPASAVRTPSSTSTAPLTDGQRLLWFGSEMNDEADDPYRISAVLRSEHRLDPERLARAIEHVAERHEAMRVGIEPDGSSQVCAAGAVPELSTTTLDSDAPEELLSAAREFALRRVDLSEPSLFRFQLVQTPSGSALQCVVPHAIFDDWSSGIFWSELSAFYRGGEKATARLPVPASYLEYARAKRQKEDSLFEQNSVHWRKMLDRAWETQNLLKHTGPWKSVPHTYSLSDDCVAGIRSLAKSQGCTVHTVALTVLATAAALETGAEESLILAHQADQPYAANTQLLGFGVNPLPVCVRLSDGSDVTDAITSTQAQILDGAERAPGIYRVLQGKRYRHLPSGFIAFNYAVQVSGQLFGTPEVTLESSSRDTVPWPAVATLVESDQGLKLTLEVSTDSDLHSRTDALMSRIERIVTAPDEPFELRRHATE